MFANGDEVTCVNDSFDIDTIMRMASLPIKNEDYIIETCFNDPKGTAAVTLVGFDPLDSNDKIASFRMDRFKKKVETEIKIEEHATEQN